MWTNPAGLSLLHWLFCLILLDQQQRALVGAEHAAHVLTACWCDFGSCVAACGLCRHHAVQCWAVDVDIRTEEEFCITLGDNATHQVSTKPRPVP